jgi:4,5-DOPA dioxygenase extradiol
MTTAAASTMAPIGRKIAPLRDQGALIVGSGFTTHNLRWFNPSAGSDAPTPAASTEFDAWARETMASGDVDSMLDFMAKAPAAHEAHPRTEHFAPLFVALGAAEQSGDLASRSVIDGFWYGLSKRSWQFG